MQAEKTRLLTQPPSRGSGQFNRSGDVPVAILEAPVPQGYLKILDGMVLACYVCAPPIFMRARKLMNEHRKIEQCERHQNVIRSMIDCKSCFSLFKNYFKTQQPHIQTQFLSTTDRSISNLFDTTLSMTTLADKSLLSGGDNKPPMLEKHLYDSWKSIMELYMMNRPHGRMILASVEKGPLVWPSITMDGVTRLKEYTELTPAEAIQADCDIKAINIILQGLPTEIYALVSQHHVAKDLWRRGNCSTQGTSLTKQERECKLYDEFDKFTYKKGESLHEYYLRFTLLLNDMNIYKMPLEQFQVNTKFLNTLPDEWSKFVIDVKLVKDLHTTNKGDDPIDAINHMMSFLTAVVTSRYPTTNNQLRNSSNPRQQATINNGRVTLQPIQGRQTSFVAGTSRTYTPGASGSNSGKQRTKAQQSKPKLYVGDIIVQTNPIEIPDSKETLALAEESRSKMLLKHKDNMMLEKEKLWNEHRIESKTMKLRMNQVLNEKNDSENKVMSKDIVTYLFNPIRGDDSVNVHEYKDKIKQDLEEIETINIELDHRVTKLIAENEHLKQTYKQLYDSIKPARIRSKEQCDDLINQVNIKSAEISDLNVSLQEKALAITALQDELKKLKGKALVDNNVSNHPSDPELHQVNVEPITPKLLNKRTAHSAYIKHSQEEATVLRDLVDHIKANYPLDPLLESALKQSTSASGSQPSGNTKKDKIQQTQSRILKNKVEAHPRKVKSSLKNKDHVVEPKGTAPVQHSKLNANSDLKCVKCNGCMLSDNHDLCVLDFINNVNARAKSRSVKKNSKRKVWKPTGKVFTNIGYIWRPTGRTFTIVGNVCPLTRITTTTKVPLRKSSALDNKTPKPVVNPGDL
ncbi:hypothetical protein Tco_0861429 [Tanacetum coccineum]|uniref:Integrase, catalytic region, zinc finger, CCHC-type, peptidase aspartic, catalytic n=1 Tax=Tanacetum coccineum TaxID=301880 RepID=A0ABQ5BJZ5_9ASTR